MVCTVLGGKKVELSSGYKGVESNVALMTAGTTTSPNNDTQTCELVCSCFFHCKSLTFRDQMDEHNTLQPLSLISITLQQKMTNLFITL